MNNLIAIVGRPNVGKSTLYNRLVGSREAIVDDFSGVTRDRQYGTGFWCDKNFIVVDTGGFVHNSNDIFEAAIRTQVRIAIDEAKAIIFMVDTQQGVTPMDEEIGQMLRNCAKPIFLCANKVDNNVLQMDALEFWNLGFDNLFPICANSGSGTGDLLDAVAEHLEPEVEYNELEEMDKLPKIAVVGQPNAGKSTIVNALLGEERNIVTDIAGTTRDSIHARYNKFGHDFIIIDTAGMRRKSRVHEDLEFYSVMRAIKALEEADVILLVVDATEGIEQQDLNLFRLAKDRNKGIVLVINKWDLIENKETNTIKEYTAKIHDRIAPFTDVPIIFTSATEKQRVFKVVETAMQVYENRTKKIPTSKLNDLLQEAMLQSPPPPHRGLFISIKYATQLPTYFPAFALFCNHPKHIREDYKNYLEKKIREAFDFTGVPISIFFRDKNA
jgi:GTP-binding protein